MNIGEKIKTMRRKKRLTQAKLAELIGREASFVSHIERNARNVSVRLLSSIATVLEISPIELLSMGTSSFDHCVEKLRLLDESNMNKVDEYLDFLVQTQAKSMAKKLEHDKANEKIKTETELRALNKRQNENDIY